VPTHVVHAAKAEFRETLARFDDASAALASGKETVELLQNIQQHPRRWSNQL
jgi:hypothetical protein